MTETDDVPWSPTPERIRRRRAVLRSTAFRRLRAVVTLCKLIEEACEEAADELEAGGVMARDLDDPRHTVRLLRSLSTQAGVVNDLVSGDLPAGW